MAHVHQVLGVDYYCILLHYVLILNTIARYYYCNILLLLIKHELKQYYQEFGWTNTKRHLVQFTGTKDTLTWSII